MIEKRITDRWKLLLAAGILLLGAGGCSGKKADEVETIKTAGELRVAIVNTDSQYTSLENGIPAGVEPELSAYIAEALGVEVRYQILEKAGALEAVKSGEADIAIGSIHNSGGMSDNYQISTPYAKGFFYAVTKRGDFVSSIGALEASVVGADRNLDEGTRSQLYGAEGISISDYTSVENAAKDIEDGTIRAYICYENQAKELLKIPGLQVQNIINLEPEEFVIAAPKESQTLISGINSLIRQYLEKEQ